MTHVTSNEETRKKIIEAEKEDANRDPITGAPGSHPVGTGIGAAAGGTLGAAVGAMAGPAGALAGAALGSTIGGAFGHGVGEMIDPTVETEYWRSNYASRPYIPAGSDYRDYGPAYQHGWESRTRYQGKSFDEVESSLRHEWDYKRGSSALNWEKARDASRDAWNRVDLRRNP